MLMKLKPLLNLTPEFWGPSDPTYYPGIDDARDRERDRWEQYVDVYQWLLDRDLDPRKEIDRDAFVRAYTEDFGYPPPLDEQDDLVDFRAAVEEAAKAAREEWAGDLAEEALGDLVLLADPQQQVDEEKQATKPADVVYYGEVVAPSRHMRKDRVSYQQVRARKVLQKLFPEPKGYPTRGSMLPADLLGQFEAKYKDMLEKQELKPSKLQKPSDTTVLRELGWKT
jgi:hypothetical protein